MVPLLFGMFIIVAPQVYFEALDQNLIEPGYWTFWLDYINPNTELLVEHHSPIGLLTWNHLWFLPYLWVYTVVILFMRKPLNAVAQSQYLQNAHSMIGITSIVCVFLLVWMLLRYRFPSTHALLDDWYNHGKYFSVFLFGYLFAQQKTWWQFVINHRRYWLAIALVCYLLAIADRQGAFDTLAELYQTSLALQLFYSTIVAINHWVWIFAAVGYAGFYLNKPSAVLAYTTKAILPWYLLHQTIIIGLAWWFRSIHWPTWIEAIAIIILTASSCWLGYELIRRSRVLSWLSGLKPTYHPREQSTQKPNNDSPSNTSGITAHNT